MLLTNGAATSRELYSPGFLTTITTMLNQALATAELPVIGVAMVTMRTRFAGLHRPDVAMPVPRSISYRAPQEAVSDTASVCTTQTAPTQI